MSWSYQSTNPCTVLVNEKQVSNSQACATTSSSTNRPNESAQQQQPAPVSQDTSDQQQDSSMGNNIGGKAREKRHADGVGVEHEHVIETIEKRVLVNITIGMDGGMGSQQLQVYQLQVAVPLKKKLEGASKQHYAYSLHEDEHQSGEIRPMSMVLVEKGDSHEVVEDEEKEEEVTTDDDEAATATTTELPICDCTNGRLDVEFKKKMATNHE
jgi:hypothetical protein